MTTIKRKYILHPLFLLAAFLLGGELRGQQKDFATWWEFTLGGGLKNGLNLNGEIEQRLYNNSRQYDRTLFTISGDYDLTDYLNLEAGFRAILITDRESRLYDLYRLHLDATGHHAFSSTDLSLRVRFQYGFEDLLFIGYFSENNFVSRQKVKLSHHFFGTRFGVETALENWIRFEDPFGRPFYKIRVSAGAVYTLSMRSRMKIGYTLEHEFNTFFPMQLHILSMGYAYSL